MPFPIQPAAIANVLRQYQRADARAAELLPLIDQPAVDAQSALGADAFDEVHYAYREVARQLRTAGEL